MLNKKLLAGAAASLALMSVVGTADAALLTIGAGTAFVTGSNNNVLGSGVSLIDNAPLTITPGATLYFSYLGAESGFTNTLHTSTGLTHTETGTSPVGESFPFPGVALPGLTEVYAGATPVLKFTGPYPDILPGLGSVGSSIAFAYLDAFGNVSSDPTNRVLIALDDGGGSPSDRDFDDAVYVVTAVPLPAAVWLFGSALLGLAGIGYRRKTGYQA